MYSGTSLLRSLSGLGHSDLNGEMIVLAGLNIIYFSAKEIIWDYPMLTTMARWLYNRGTRNARFDCTFMDIII